MPSDEFPGIEAAGLPPGDWFALTVEGDSMDRISPPGSIIFVNRRDRKLIPNGCYVILNEDGEATYKRYRPDPDRFEPVSGNKDLDPLFPKGTITVIGRVRRTMMDF
jgi:SOS-response transcriptional repressor LexA